LPSSGASVPSWRQAVKPFAEAHKVNYGTEICGFGVGAKSLRKRS